jgi:hypothetical protein
MRHLLALLTVPCILMLGCGEDPPEPADTEISVCAAAKEPPADVDRVRISGRGAPIGRPGPHVGFVLSGGGCVLYVKTPGSQGDSIEEGEAITAVGRLLSVDEQTARRVAFALEGEQKADRVTPPPAAHRAGATYLDASALLREESGT